MSLMRSPKQYRAFMNSQPQSKSAAAGVFPQSLSGSETDISTSNENLSNEEKYVIRHTERQEPQGEENLQSSSNRNSLRDSLPSNRSSLDVSSSSYNTLIIHSVGDDSWTGRNSGPKDLDTQYSNLASLKECPSPAPGNGNNGNGSKDHGYYDASNANLAAGVQLTEIPDDYLNQSSVLKHLAKEVKLDNRAPPEYATYMKSRLPAVVMRNKNLVRNVSSLSKSQPDLRKIDKVAERMQRDASVPRPKTNGREESADKESMWTLEFLIKENHELKLELEKCYLKVSKTQKLEEEVLKIHRSHEELVQTCDRRERLERAARARLQSDCRRLQELNRSLNDQIGLLSNDGLRREVNKRELLITQLITQNKELQAAKERQEIELTAQRATLQEQRTHIDILEAALTNAQGNVMRLEEESRKKQVYVDRVVQLQRALSSLQLASDRREQSERQLRQQLEAELERTKSNSAHGHHHHHHLDDAMKRGAWGEHTASVVNAVAENAELKKRLRDREEKIMRLEGECSKWEQRYLEESALRQAAIDAASIPKDAKIAALEKTSQETEKIIAEARTEKIRHMDEAHAAQKRVADLESRLKDLESKLAERDAMIRVLQKHTYDKDVSSMLSRSPHHTPHPSIGSSELDHVLGTTVSREDLVSSVLTSSTSYGSGNSYAGSDASSFMPSSYKYESKTFDSTKQTLDNQIKEIDNQLDSQLLSKRALCCFPGFANPVAAQRKGKIPKPLLAGVSGVAASTAAAAAGMMYDAQFVLAGGRHEQGDILLLEKQGRSSQQQRMSEPSAGGASTNQQSHSSTTAVANNNNGGGGNLPPSSLPRPPRPKTTTTAAASPQRRLGEYNRLPEHHHHHHHEMARKKSDGGNSLSSNASSRNASPARSLIPSPAPRKLGEYGRLSESGASSSCVSLRKPAARARSGDRDSAASAFSDSNSATSLPHPGKVRFYSGPSSACSPRRSASLARDSKSSTDSTSSNKFRIQF